MASSLFWTVFFGYPAVVAFLNLILMDRPAVNNRQPAQVAVLIPARNEAENLTRLLPALIPQVASVYVYDDASEDKTAEVAAALGAKVIRGKGPDPGWTGKNFGCHQLALVATEDSSAQWWLFLDADTEVTPDFAAQLNDMVERIGKHFPVISGFPKMIPGAGPEPVALFWVPWLLLATIPFGLIYRTHLNHPRFTNGQFVLWRASRYTELWPHERCKGVILEDVTIGRLLATEKIPCAVVVLSRSLLVHMYQTAKQAIDGMSKNSFEVTGSTLGSCLVALLLLMWALGGFFAGGWVPLALFTVSVLSVGFIVGSRWWVMLVSPLSLLTGSYVFVRSVLWRKNGGVAWKGRRYPN